MRIVYTTLLQQQFPRESLLYISLRCFPKETPQLDEISSFFSRLFSAYFFYFCFSLYKVRINITSDGYLTYFQSTSVFVSTG